MQSVPFGFAPFHNAGIRKVAMDGGGPQDGLTVEGRTRRDQVPARNTPLAQWHGAQFDQPQVTVRHKLRMRAQVHVVQGEPS